ncbi:MAG: sterol desaturase family protein [Phycisphaerales bacterium]|nr:sterol desaturase family protein [Phycisphaerales bacterium]
MPTEQSIAIASSIALGALWLVESLVPLLQHFRSGRDRAAHAGRNIALGLMNAGVRALLFTALIWWTTEYARANSFGLLHVLGLPLWARFAAAILLLDAWGYIWHVLSHKVPVLWRFHAVHHHDREVDATTALRFHAGEILIGSAALLFVMPVLGITVAELLVYELILIPVSIFHHANVRLPERLDRVLRLVIVTPRMHIVHHSSWEPETDSNFSGLFSFWDRLAGTFRLRDPASIRLGLEGYSTHDHSTLRGMLATPLSRSKAQYGTPPAIAGGLHRPTLAHDHQGP